jgi:hypothetical protein
MAKRDWSGKPCSYCENAPAAGEDHVFAPRLFPKEHCYRDRLPKVPACADCQHAKERDEDIACIVTLPGHNSPASETVYKERILRGLRKNKKLARLLRGGLHRAPVQYPTGLIVPTPVVELDVSIVRNIFSWFRWVTRGLFFFETGSIQRRVIRRPIGQLQTQKRAKRQAVRTAPGDRPLRIQSPRLSARCGRHEPSPAGLCPADSPYLRRAQRATWP